MLHRETLIKNLETVLPALADKAMTPVLSHFCFTGKKLYGFNGQIAIVVPCETDFVGAVPKALLEMLKTTGAKEIEITESKGNIEVKAAAAKFKLATLPPEDFAFDTAKAKLPKELYAVDSREFMEGLRCCMRSINPSDTSRADYAGITVIPRKRDLWLFSFDRVTISHAIAKGRMANEERAILPSAWCAQALSIAEKADEIEIEIDDERAVLSFDDCTLYGLLVVPDQPLDFVEVVGVRLKDVGDLFPLEEIRNKLEAMLSRAKIISRNGIARTRTDVEVRDGKLSFKTESEAGEAFDIVNGLDGHPNIRGAIDPDRVLEGIGFDKFAMTGDTVVMASEDDRLVYLVSSGSDD